VHIHTMHVTTHTYESCQKGAHTYKSCHMGERERGAKDVTRTCINFAMQERERERGKKTDEESVRGPICVRDVTRTCIDLACSGKRERGGKREMKRE